MPKRSVVLQAVEVAGGLEVVPGAQRILGWPLPERAELRTIDGTLAVIAHFGDDSGDVPVAGDREVRTAFQRFRMLDRASPSSVRDFVRSFGPLFDAEEWSGLGYVGLPYRMENGAEAVSWYTELAGILAATARLTLRIRQRQRLDFEDLQTLARRLGEPSIRGYMTDYTVKRAGAICARLVKEASGPKVPYVDAARRIPEGVVNWWLGAKQVRPMLRWDDDRPPTVEWTGELWGAIGAQLLADVRRGGMVSECDWCGREVERKRAPKVGQLVWCGDDECRRRRNAEAKRRSRARAPKRIRK